MVVAAPIFLIFGTTALLANPLNLSVGFWVGPYLPSNLEGVTEVMQVEGARISLFDGEIGFEAWASHSAQSGSVINYGGASISKALKIPDLDEFTILIVAGLDVMYYRPSAQSGASSTYTHSNGLHAGGAITFPIVGRWALRGGTMILNGPGRSAQVEVGFQYGFTEQTRGSR